MSFVREPFAHPKRRVPRQPSPSGRSKTMNRTLLLSLLTIAGTGAMPAAARAQDGAAVDMTGMGIYAMEDSVMEAAGRSVTRRAPGAAAPARAVSPAAFAYRPSQEVRRRNVAGFVKKLTAANPQGAGEVRRLVEDPTLFAKIDRALRGVGGRTDNAADAFASYWIAAWYAAHGRDDTPDAATFAAVRRQAADALGAVPQLAGAGDAVKQQVAEANLVQAVLIAATMEGVGRDPAARGRIAAAVRKGARASGLDLDAIALTRNGFVPTRRTGAVDPARDGEGARGGGTLLGAGALAAVAGGALYYRNRARG
jgi:hypothetical protein